ncbi:nucleotidyltransferase family protein [Microvirga terricola]|uniref:Nucleotidyltransferase family protein n=1 Tax=Microvirga terricola TaxID=2719797 RepID=A0ABX0VC59_9HYPH|nr:nucleotidyltransferase family protein [Microvirga terricola]NIX77278.1 nucleotidyltransferase family protein [Microvirga terricola]
MSGVAALILAAGQGSRFGTEPKLLAHFRGKPLIRHVVEAVMGSSARPVIVVTGYRAREVERTVSGLEVGIVRNPSFSEGLSTSLKTGFAALPPEVQGVIILLGDMPLITTGLINVLIAAWSEERPYALVPTFNGRRGNPVVLSREIGMMVGSLSGDTGASLILRGRSDVLEWPVDDPAILEDIDTPDMLQEAAMLK